MAQSRKLRFKRNLCDYSLTADGYRLATVEEVRSNEETIIRHGLPPVKQHRDKYYDVGGAMRLLDGYARYHPNQSSLEVQQDFKRFCGWKIVVKEQERDSSALYSKDGNVLRKDLYSKISLSESARVVAFQLTVFQFDAEVLSWLLSKTCTEELKRFEKALHDQVGHYESPFIKAMRALLSAMFSLQLPLREDSHGNTVVDYVMEYAKNAHNSKGDTWNVMGFVELLVNAYSAKIVNSPNSKGLSFIDRAAEAPACIDVFTKLLALSESKELPQIIPHFEKVLAEAIERGYVPLVETLLETEDELAHITIDVSLGFLRETARKGHLNCLRKLLDFISKSSVDRDGHEDSSVKADVIRKRDKFGRNLLHYAAEAPKGDSVSKVVELLLKSSESSVDLVFSTDYNGRTPLQIAASKNNTSAVTSLLSILEKGECQKYLQQTDSSSRTALQIAAKGGHKETVELLLGKGSNPLKERDASGRTALHYAALGKRPKTALSVCKTLLESQNSRGDKALLLWANAAGIGTADEMEEVDHSVKTYLREQKNEHQTNLLQAAVVRQEVEMACQLLNRGAEIEDIRDDTWKNSLPDDQKKAVDNVMEELNRMKEQGRDRPSAEDRLGRSLLAGGLASLFLNRFIDSPITVGISGEWGMGKSSLMIQVEKILLLTSSQLTFPNLLPSEDFVGAQKVILTKWGKRMYAMVKQGAAKFLFGTKSKRENPLIHVLKEYQREYHSVYKALACMDTRQLLQSNVQYSLSDRQEYAFREVPRILTVQYNAWHYTNEHQAWAGLAVSITKEIEKAMTREQWLSTCWRYSWMKNKINIWLYVFLPCLLATFLSGWVYWGSWMLLKNSKFEGLKYGSIPITIIVIVWVVIKSIISVVKPVSTQMMGYMTSPNHASHLGYQEEVISDINFLKKELGKKSYLFFSLILGKWCWSWFGFCADYMENTSIVKFTPASEDQLRIITFVDDLDRCEEKVVLQVLSAISLVLAECKINVIMGMDKKMIYRAIRRNFEDLHERDIAEKFICKIVQIPLSLPDSTEEEMQTFLEYQLGWKSTAQRKSGAHWKPSVADDEDPQYSTSDEEDNTSSQCTEGQGTTVVDIDCHIKDGTGSSGIRKKIFDYLLKKIPMCTNSSGEEKLPLSKEIRLTREMALSKCNQHEADVFLKLIAFGTGNQKFPRECKRLLNYHRFASNVLSQRGEVHFLPTWKVELVAWIFVCWQWKDEMNILIKGWNKYARVGRNKNESGDESSVAWHGPSLARIVKQYVNDPQSLRNHEEAEKDTTEKRTDLMLKAKGTLKELLLYVLGHDQDNLENGPTQESWHKLKDALGIQDVSMKGIQMFQNFRLHCETDYLPWSLPDSKSNHTG